jgi:hypothetical protein
LTGCTQQFSPITAAPLTILILYNEHKSNNNTIFDRTDYETCYKTNIYRVSQKKLIHLIFKWITKVSVFFYSPCRFPCPWIISIQILTIWLISKGLLFWYTLQLLVYAFVWFRVQSGNKIYTSELFKDDRNCMSLKNECNLKCLKTHDRVFFHIAWETLLLLVNNMHEKIMQKKIHVYLKIWFEKIFKLLHKHCTSKTYIHCIFASSLLLFVRWSRFFVSVDDPSFMVRSMYSKSP